MTIKTMPRMLRQYYQFCARVQAGDVVTDRGSAPHTVNLTCFKILGFIVRNILDVMSDLSS